MLEAGAFGRTSHLFFSVKRFIVRLQSAPKVSKSNGHSIACSTWASNNQFERNHDDQRIYPGTLPRAACIMRRLVSAQAHGQPPNNHRRQHPRATQRQNKQRVELARPQWRLWWLVLRSPRRGGKARACVKGSKGGRESASSGVERA